MTQNVKGRLQCCLGLLAQTHLLTAALRALILQGRVDDVLGLLKCGSLEEPSMVKLRAEYATLAPV